MGVNRRLIYTTIQGVGLGHGQMGLCRLKYRGTMGTGQRGVIDNNMGGC